MAGLPNGHDKARSTQQRHRDKKRERGECGYNGCHAVSGDRYYCGDHAQVHKAAVVRYRAGLAEDAS